MSKTLLKGLGYLMLLMFTTGIALPWIISNVVMPVWMIVFTIGALIAVWVVLLEKPYLKLIKFIMTMRRNDKNVD